MQKQCMYSFTGYKGFKRELKPRADNQMHLTGMTISKEAGSLLFWSIKMCVKTMPMRLNISNDINNLGNMAAQLKFAKMHLNKEFWDNVVWTDEVNIWKSNTIKTNTSHQLRSTVVVG